MKIIALFSLLGVLAFNINAADTISIFYCYEKAIQNHPLSRDKEFLNEIYQLKLKNINSGWFPTLDLNAQATYQSDVVNIDMDFSGITNLFNLISYLHPGQVPVQEIPSIEIPSAPKDQYKMTLDVSQVIYDGGAIKRNKTVEIASLSSNLQQIKVELYQVINHVNNIYFSSLIIQKNIALMQLIRNVLIEKQKVVESGVKNGIILSSNLDGLNAELLKIEQQLLELDLTKNALLKNLGELTGEVYNEQVVLDVPEIEILDTLKNQRPELKLFDLQKEKLEASKDLIKTKRLPKAFAFSQAGYGNPGLNMLSDEFDTYYIVGAGVKWNIYDWNTSNRERQIMEINKQMIDTKRENFNRNLNMAIENNISEIDKYKALLETDEKIISAREKITKIYSSHLENGIVNSSEYIAELNNEKEAKINFEMHKIQLMQAKINYLTLIGQL
ncbi:MAG: TolC family protein [Bacteroidales bacterium]|nr:TolC family protein [Bacteroidales bacterium]